jgi:hypothetical protein
MAATEFQVVAPLPVLVPSEKGSTANFPCVYCAGKFYLVYTDTTGVASPPPAYNALYVIRSPDPTFQTAVEELTSTGFQPQTPAIHTQHFLLPCISVDFAFSDMFQAFAIACDGYNTSATRLLWFDRNFTQLGTVDIPGHWTEGPGLVVRPDHHFPPPQSNQSPLTVPGVWLGRPRLLSP